MSNVIAGDLKNGPKPIEHVKKTCARCNGKCWVSARLFQITKFPTVLCIRCLEGMACA